MKNTLKLLAMTFLVCLLSVGAVSAQKAKKVNMKKPDQVALAFMKAFTAFDFATVKTLTTEESHQMVDMLQMAMGMAAPEELEKAKQEAAEGAKNIKKATCSVNGDDAACKFCCDENNNPISDTEFKLKKVKGKWYVHISKEDMMGGEGEPPVEAPSED